MTVAYALSNPELKSLNAAIGDRVDNALNGLVVETIKQATVIIPLTITYNNTPYIVTNGSGTLNIGNYYTTGMGTSCTTTNVQITSGTSTAAYYNYLYTTGTTATCTVPTNYESYINNHVPINYSIRGDITWNVNGNITLAEPFNEKELKKQQLREFMRSKMLVKQGASKMLNRDITPEELKSRNLLRDMLTEKDWRRYVTNGFIMVEGKSGKWYQIFNKSAGYCVGVFEKNQKIASLCIHTVKDCPPTDHVINMKVLVELDEEQIYKGSNVTNIRNNSRLVVSKSNTANKVSTLLDYYNQLKANKQPYYTFQTTENWGVAA